MQEEVRNGTEGQADWGVQKAFQKSQCTDCICGNDQEANSIIIGSPVLTLELHGRVEEHRGPLGGASGPSETRKGSVPDTDQGAAGPKS